MLGWINENTLVQKHVSPFLLSFSADDPRYPVREITTDNTTPLVVAQLDERKNNKSATCLTNHDRKMYADRSTQMPVPFDKCLRPVEYEFTSQTLSQHSDTSTSHSQTLMHFDEYSSPLEYEPMGRKASQHSEDSAVCSQMPTPIDEYLRPLEYESMIAKPYQCSQSSIVSSQTIAELSHRPIPWRMGPGFLVYASDNAAKKPNVQTADYTIDDTKVTLPILHQDDNKRANCLANERSNPIGPLDQSTKISVPSEECFSKLEYDPITAIAHQCTEGFLSKSGHCFVTASSEMTIPQEVDSTLLVRSPGCGFWPKSMVIEQSTVVLDDKPDQRLAMTLLLPTLRPFLSTSGESHQMEQDI